MLFVVTTYGVLLIIIIIIIIVVITLGHHKTNTEISKELNPYRKPTNA
jgi:hypothetical protein